MTANDKAENVKTIRELLGMPEDDFGLPSANVPPAPTGPAPVLNLPVPEIEEEIRAADEAEAKAVEPHEPEATEFEPVIKAKGRIARWLGRDWVRYPAIFFVTLGFFYLALNFGGLSKQFLGFIFRPAGNQEAALGSDKEKYDEWVVKYYAYINNNEVIAANADTDGDGLTNMDEFYLDTNPFRPDTDRDGIDDGAEILAAANPLYEGALLAYQSEIIAQHINVSTVASRRNFQGASSVAGANLQFPGANPAPPLNNFAVDTAKPGEISIPRLGILAPVTWSKTFAGMEEDLKYGAAHHPQTPYPGQYGTSSIHGHSSGNWNDGDFKTLFTKINFLEPGDEVFVTVHSLAGESRKYRFVVRTEKVYAKTDPEQFAPRAGYFLNLSTSWPVGTARERYVVTTELAGI